MSKYIIIYVPIYFKCIVNCVFENHIQQCHNVV